MAGNIVDLGLITTVLLACLVWKMATMFFAHMQNIKKVQNLPVPEFRGHPILGFIVIFIGFLRSVPKGMPTNAFLLPVVIGMSQVFRDHGIFRINAGWIKQVIVVYTKEAAEAVLNDPLEQKKSDEYVFLRDFVGTGLITASHQKWKKHRRVLSPAFNTRILDSFQPVMYEHSCNLVKNIKSKIGKELVHIEKVLAQCSLGIVSETAMGVKISSEDGKDIPYVTAVNNVLALLGQRIISPWLWPNIIFWLTPSGRELKKNLKIVHSFVKEIVLKKKKEILENQEPLSQSGLIKRRPFLEHLLLHNLHSKPEDSLSDQDIQDETHTFTFAGFDTISVTTYWAMYYIGLYPDVMKKVSAEINSIKDGNKDDPITVEDLKHMDYLDRVIKESQRLNPIIPGLLRILRNDIKIGNLTIPRGTTVSVGLGALHSDPKVFPDPELFNPDRFLNTSISPFQLMPFSAGPRNCIGQKFALLEMKTILSNLIRHFEWTSLDQRDLVLQNPDIVNRSHKPLRILFKERLNSSSNSF